MTFTDMFYEEFIAMTNSKKITPEEYNTLYEPVYMNGAFNNKHEFIDFFKKYGKKGCEAALTQIKKIVELEKSVNNLTKSNKTLNTALLEEKEQLRRLNIKLNQNDCDAMAGHLKRY